MIRLVDAAVLAYTKLRMHRIRTGLTVGVAGILFGLILAVIIVAQGAFDSVERFGKEGLGDRAIVNVSRFGGEAFDVWNRLQDEDFVDEVEAYHRSYVAKKTRLAAKYQIEYDAKTEDLSPIEIDPITKRKQINEDNVSNQFVQDVAIRKTQALYEPINMDEYLKPYQSAHIIGDNFTVMPDDGEVAYMKGGKEQAVLSDAQRLSLRMGAGQEPAVMVMNETLTQPFIVSSSFDGSKGEVPAVVSYGLAEKLLGLKKLTKDNTTEERFNRLQEVRSRVGEITASYCYRNAASQQLLAQAMGQQQERTRNKDNVDYVAPRLQYNMPADDSCGAVTVARDDRTDEEKQQATRQKQYEAELGIDLGEPVQHKITIRGVGVSGDVAMDGMAGTVGSMVTSLLGSWLSYEDNFVIPHDMLQQLPAETRPDYLFTREGDNAGGRINERMQVDSYFVEFADKQEARDLLERNGMFGGSWDDSSRIGVAPFGSGTLMIDEIKVWFWRILLWALAVVGGVALIILASLIGRMVSDGRRESAIFRAIGARRSDISAIYGTYALLLSIRVALFAVILGAVIALVVELLYWQEATIASRVAYAASDTSKEFHFFGLASWYILLLLGSVVVVGLLASIVPILLGARRNPIHDMRNDT